jgi:hypothetical protein
MTPQEKQEIQKTIDLINQLNLQETTTTAKLTKLFILLIVQLSEWNVEGNPLIVVEIVNDELQMKELDPMQLTIFDITEMRHDH